MKKLASYVNGSWVVGTGPAQTLYNPATEEAIAETSTEGIDFAAAVDYARTRGGPALRALTFAERGKLLQRMAKAIHDAREELGKELGDTRVIVDGDRVQLGRTARYQGVHIRVPRRGVAVHVNAFNFPAWGLCEKAATALLAGMPVISKPATATALLSHRMVEIFVQENILPAGALSLIAGGAGSLLDHLGGQDVLSFTGSSDTARFLRGLPNFLAQSVHVNIEADSLNAAVLAPDVEPGSETWQLFLVDVVRDMTQKAGQKCTAIRRVFVPEARFDQAAEALSERLGGITVGNPAQQGVSMGPLSSAAQLRDVRSGIDRLAAQTEAVFGGTGEVTAVGAPAGKGYYVGPVLRRARDARAATAVHEHEVFGPVVTLMPYSGDAEEAAELVALGSGGLVASAYTDERAYAQAVTLALAPWNGRIYLGSAKMAAQSMGPGTVMASLVHGGPGRAGGGEELGNARGMALYQQRTAVQGDKGMLKALTGGDD